VLPEAGDWLPAQLLDGSAKQHAGGSVGLHDLPGCRVNPAHRIGVGEKGILGAQPSVAFAPKVQTKVQQQRDSGRATQTFPDQHGDRVRGDFRGGQGAGQFPCGVQQQP